MNLSFSHLLIETDIILGPVGVLDTSPHSHVCILYVCVLAGGDSSFSSLRQLSYMYALTGIQLSTLSGSCAHL